VSTDFIIQVLKRSIQYYGCQRDRKEIFVNELQTTPSQSTALYGIGNKSKVCSDAAKKLKEG